ncbi:MAG: hypothetical protein M9894_28670 [Planctomycetes bacterium]|nr:hypothetical protein [Planctomycetota bacterium]
MHPRAAPEARDPGDREDALTASLEPGERLVWCERTRLGARGAVAVMLYPDAGLSTAVLLVFVATPLLLAVTLARQVAAGRPPSWPDLLVILAVAGVTFPIACASGALLLEEYAGLVSSRYGITDRGRVLVVTGPATTIHKARDLRGIGCGRGPVGDVVAVVDGQRRPLFHAVPDPAAVADLLRGLQGGPKEAA